MARRRRNRRKRGEEEEEAGRHASQEMEAGQDSIIRIAGGVGEEEGRGEEEGGVLQSKQSEGQQCLESLCPSSIMR